MAEVRQVRVKENLLQANDYLAQELQKRWDRTRTFVVNLLSSPGSGKTSLLEATLPVLKDAHRVLVLEGDIETQRDAERIRGVGVDAVQITTGGACHLDANMVQQAWELHAGDEPYDYVFIENVGNLVCPSNYALGEHLRVVLLSVPEGDDKPEKYPKAFRTSQVMAITKTDLLEHFDFDLERASASACRIQPELQLCPLSAKTGEGLDSWIRLLRDQRSEKFASA